MSFLVGLCSAALGVVSLSACGVVVQEPLASGAAPSSAVVVATDASKPLTASRPRDTENRVQGDFSGTRAWIANRESKVTLSLAAYGCAGHARRVVAGERVDQGARVEYRHPGITEWYARGERGVEQGFTLEHAPCADGDMELVVSVIGLSPRGSASVNGLDLLDERGRALMHYTDLSARDARGRALPATMSLENGQIALRVALRGATYPVVVDPEVWSQQGSALPRTDGATFDYFGSSVGVSNDTALIGASFRTVAGQAYQGAAYVFVRSGLAWQQQGSPLLSSDGATDDTFGTAVSISGDTAIIGASGKSTALNVTQGAAYVFARSNGVWAEQGSTLAPMDAAAYDYFGASVGISGDTLIVGAPGKTVGGNRGQGGAYVFVRNAGAWAQQGPLLPRTDGAFLDGFGVSVAVDADTAIVGAPYKTIGVNQDQGATYVFVRTGTTWTQQGPALVGADSVATDFLATSIAISGDTAVVGASAKTIGTNSGQGAVYVFVRNGTTWTQQGPALTLPDGRANEGFGGTVSISGDTLVVGDPGRTIGGNANQGATYVFARQGTVWTQQGPALVQPDGTTNDSFGNSVSVSGHTLVIGAIAETIGTVEDQGTAFVFVDACATDTDCVASAYCSSGACMTRCAHDSDCAASSYCSLNGSCQPQLTQGTACTEAAGVACKEAGCAVCSTGHCVDGLCCDTACVGTCEACSAVKTGGAAGTCLAIPADQDPDNECAADPGYPDSCKADGSCDGSRACRSFAKAGMACGATTCASGAVSGAVCDGAGTCAVSRVSCAPYVCDVSACSTTCSIDSDCDAVTGYCLNGTCAEKKATGQSCQSGAQCAAGFCADGVCCVSACAGQCEACAEKGSEGACIPVSGVPRASRSACAGDPAVCGGTCDGTDADECQYAAATRACAQTCASGLASEGACDAAGNCSTPSTTSCGAYACGQTTCLTSCASDTDCATGNYCTDGQCAPVTPSTTPIATTPTTPTPATPATPAKTDASAGCGCHLVPVPRSPLAAVAGLLLLGISGLRRRRSSGSLKA